MVRKHITQSMMKFSVTFAKGAWNLYGMSISKLVKCFHYLEFNAGDVRQPVDTLKLSADFFGLWMVLPIHFCGFLFLDAANFLSSYAILSYSPLCHLEKEIIFIHWLDNFNTHEQYLAFNYNQHEKYTETEMELL